MHRRPARRPLQHRHPERRPGQLGRDPDPARRHARPGRLSRARRCRRAGHFTVWSINLGPDAGSRVAPPSLAPEAEGRLLRADERWRQPADPARGPAGTDSPESLVELGGSAATGPTPAGGTYQSRRRRRRRSTPRARSRSGPHRERADDQRGARLRPAGRRRRRRPSGSATRAEDMQGTFGGPAFFPPADERRGRRRLHELRRARALVARHLPVPAGHDSRRSSASATPRRPRRALRSDGDLHQPGRRPEPQRERRRGLRATVRAAHAASAAARAAALFVLQRRHRAGDRHADRRRHHAAEPADRQSARDRRSARSRRIRRSRTPAPSPSARPSSTRTRSTSIRSPTVKENGVFLVDDAGIHLLASQGEDSGAGCPFFNFRDPDHPRPVGRSSAPRWASPARPQPGLFVSDAAGAPTRRGRGSGPRRHDAHLAERPQRLRRRRRDRLPGPGRQTRCRGGPPLRARRLPDVVQPVTPGPQGGSIRSIGRPSVSSTGHVAFRALLPAAQRRRVRSLPRRRAARCSRSSASARAAATASTDASPSFNQNVALNASDQIAFLATVGGGKSRSAILLATPATLSVRQPGLQARPGDAAPDHASRSRKDQRPVLGRPEAGQAAARRGRTRRRSSGASR